MLETGRFRHLGTPKGHLPKGLTSGGIKRTVHDRAAIGHVALAERRGGKVRQQVDAHDRLSARAIAHAGVVHARAQRARAPARHMTLERRGKRRRAGDVRLHRQRPTVR